MLPKFFIGYDPEDKKKLFLTHTEEPRFIARINNDSLVYGTSRLIIVWFEQGDPLQMTMVINQAEKFTDKYLRGTIV